ncbi:hypothetical protein Ancab_000135 [Ancistrocladus abbreviatus]
MGPGHGVVECGRMVVRCSSGNSICKEESKDDEGLVRLNMAILPAKRVPFTKASNPVMERGNGRLQRDYDLTGLLGRHGLLNSPPKIRASETILQAHNSETTSQLL